MESKTAAACFFYLSYMPQTRTTTYSLPRRMNSPIHEENGLRAPLGNFSNVFLFDTCVISELVKAKPAASVLAWVDSQQETDLYPSVVTIASISRSSIPGS